MWPGRKLIHDSTYCLRLAVGWSVRQSISTWVFLATGPLAKVTAAVALTQLPVLSDSWTKGRPILRNKQSQAQPLQLRPQTFFFEPPEITTSPSFSFTHITTIVWHYYHRRLCCHLSCVGCVDRASKSENGGILPILETTTTPMNSIQTWDWTLRVINRCSAVTVWVKQSLRKMIKN